MKVYNPKEPLLSIHIPKCGGTSFINVLSKWFGKNLYQHYFDEVNAKMPPKAPVKNFFGGYRSDICIHGHFNGNRKFGVDDYYPEIKQAITFIRDPLEIQLSVFYYNHKMMEKGASFRDGKKREITHDIDEFLEQGSPFIRSFLPAKMTLDNMEQYFNDYFVHVGIMEEYQKSLDIIAEKLGKPKMTIAKENASERFSDPSPSSIEKFKSKCAFEYALYDYAVKQNT